MHEIKVHDIKQRSDEWYEIRRGCLSASMANRIITAEGKRSNSIQDVINEMVAQRITGEINEIPVTEAMQHGIDTEDEAVKFFEFANDVTVQKIGFVTIDKPDVRIGCSPDGIIKETKHLLEVKCPQAKKQIKVLRDAKLPTEYKAQTQMQLYVCNAEKLEFISYHPKSIALMVSVERDDVFLHCLKNLLDEANDKINELTEQLRRK